MTLPPDLLDRTRKITTFSQQLYSAIRRLQVDLHAAGCKFPEALDLEVGHLERVVDHLYLLLKLPPVANGETQSGRDGS